MITQQYFDDYCDIIAKENGANQKIAIKQLVNQCFITARHDYECGFNDAKNGLIKQCDDDWFYNEGYKNGLK